MNKKRYELYKQLEKELELSAMEVYKWYSNNIEELSDESKSQVFFNEVDGDALWFDLKEGFGGCSEWINKVLPLELLFLNHQERKEYSDKYHQDKAEKFKAERKRAQQQKQLDKANEKTKRYETYLELKEEFEDDV